VQTFGNEFCANIFCSSIDNLECTPTDRQMYPWGCMYPRLGTPGLEYRNMLLIKIYSFNTVASSFPHEKFPFSTLIARSV